MLINLNVNYLFIYFSLDCIILINYTWVIQLVFFWIKSKGAMHGLFVQWHGIHSCLASTPALLLLCLAGTVSKGHAEGVRLQKKRVELGFCLKRSTCLNEAWFQSATPIFPLRWYPSWSWSLFPRVNVQKHHQMANGIKCNQHSPPIMSELLIMQYRVIIRLNDEMDFNQSLQDIGATRYFCKILIFKKY